MTAWAIVVLFQLSVPVVATEEPTVVLRAEAAPKEIHIGDRISFTIMAAYSGVDVAEQHFSTATGEFEILASRAQKGKPDANGKNTVAFAFALTTFSTGTITIPAMPVMFRKEDGSLIETRTTAIPITVKSTLAEQGDKGGLKPAKGLYNVRSYLWIWILLAALGIALIVWLWTQRTRSGVTVVEKQEPLISPEDEALQALDALLSEPVTDETIKEYYFRLSRILRRYIERRYGVSALEMTTAELVAAIRRLDLPLAAAQTFREFIDNADLVKFAKLMPTPEEIPADGSRVRTFVEATTPRPIVKGEEPASAVVTPEEPRL